MQGNIRPFEELLTMVDQIESISNYRPIIPMSSAVSDLEALIPGHFLIECPMTAIVEHELINIKKINLLVGIGLQNGFN